MVIFLLYCYLEACNANCQCVVCDVEFAGFSLKECSDLGFFFVVVVYHYPWSPKDLRKETRIILILHFKVMYRNIHMPV